MSISTTLTCLLDPSSDGDSTTALNSLFQGLKSFPVKRLFFFRHHFVHSGSLMGTSGTGTGSSLFAYICVGQQVPQLALLWQTSWWASSLRWTLVSCTFGIPGHSPSCPHSLLDPVALLKIMWPLRATQLLQGRWEESKVALWENHKDPGRQAPEQCCNQIPQSQDLCIEARSPHCHAEGHLKSPSTELYCSYDEDVNQSLHLPAVLTQISRRNYYKEQ